MTRAAALGALCFCAAAHADVFDTFGFGPRATAMGGAMTAEANDFTAAFYNPALLIRPPESTLGITFAFFKPVTEVTATSNNAMLDCTYCAPPDTVGTSVGIAGPLGGRLKKRVALGIGAHLPFQRLVHVNMPDPSRPFWATYQANSERLTVFAGGAIRIFDWLSIGLGIQALADLVGTGADTRVDVFSKQVKAQQLDAELQTRVAPNAGFIIQPIPSLRFGFNYRSEMQLRVVIPATVELDGIGSLAFKLEGVTHFSPHTFNLGVAWDVTDQFTLSAEGSYQMWSRMPSPYMHITIDVGGRVLDALGLDSALDLESQPASPGFQDTITAKLGGEYRLTKRFAARLGGFFRPTAVPRQSAPGTNILDGNTLAGTAGVGFNFDDPLEVFQAPITIDISGLAAMALPRQATKEPTDSVPSYSYSAKIFGMSAAVRFDF